MVCSIEGCGEERTNSYRFVSPYCRAHDLEFRGEFGFCNDHACYQTHPKVKGTHFCAKHGGEDYTPRTKAETAI